MPKEPRTQKRSRTPRNPGSPAHPRTAGTASPAGTDRKPGPPNPAGTASPPNPTGTASPPGPPGKPAWPAKARRPANLIVLLSAGHACVDVYQGAVAALVPFFLAEHAYGYAAASGIVLAASLVSSVAQPLFGALTDRWPMPWILPLSTVLAGAGVALSGLTGSYALTLAFVAVSGAGVAAYHPESARVARLAARGSHSAMGWFSVGGNLGFAAAPLLVAAVVAAGGLRLSPLLALPALAGAALCLPVLRRLREAADDAGPAEALNPAPAKAAARHQDAGPEIAPPGHAADTTLPPAPTPAPVVTPPGDAAATAHDQAPAEPPDTPHAPAAKAAPAAPADDVSSFLRLSLAVVCRSIVFTGLSTFAALYVRQRVGGGTAAGTAALFVLYLGGAVGSVLGGSLAGRWDRVTVARRSYLLSVAAVAGLLLAPGPLVYLFVALASLGLYVPFSLQVTLGQDYLPSRVGTAGGVTLGLTVSIGGLASPLIGALADATSLRTALVPLVAMPALSWLAFRTLPEPAVPALGLPSPAPARRPNSRRRGRN